MLKRPLLAAKTTDEDLKKLRWPMLLSPKIDGIRALVVNGQLVSRTLKPIRNRWTQQLFGRPELEGLDGELVVGEPWDKDLMQKTSSGVMSEHGQPAVRFFVFDKWNHPGDFNTRQEKVWDMVEDIGHPLKYISQFPVYSYQELIEIEQRILLDGYEGVMLRSINGPYKQNRSTLREAILLKVKRFHDAEAEVLGYEPLYRNTNQQTKDERGYAKRSTESAGKIADECLGSLNVRCLETGTIFDIGSGFTESQRYDLWERRGELIGKLVKYKSFKASGVKDKPRFPIFLGFRDREDM